MFRCFLLIACISFKSLAAVGDPVLLTDPPSNFSPKAEIAVVLPFLNDKILLLQRLPTHPQANLWCAPGGKIKIGELPLFAAIRELKEETGIESDANSLSYLGRFYVRYPNGDFIAHLFKLHLSQYSIPIKISDEHQAYGLYSTKELKSLLLTPGLNECLELAFDD